MNAYDRELMRQMGVVISPTLDTDLIDATRTEIIEPLRADGHSVEFVAEVAADHLAEQVAKFRQEREVAEAVRGIGPRWDETAPDGYDPTDDALEAVWLLEGWSERNAKVMRLVADIESGAA